MNNFPEKSHASWQDKEEFGGVYVSYASGAQLKEVDGTFFYEGFVSDPTWDTGNDIMEDQGKLVGKLNEANALASKFSYRHDWMKASNRNDYPPFGTLASPAQLRTNPISGKEAAWASYKLNNEYPNFQSKLNQIKEGHVRGLSIEYDVLPGGASFEVKDGVRKRHINDYTLLGVGAAARPMHPNAIATGFYAKEYEAECGGNKIGKHNDVPDDEFERDALEEGTAHEMEHTDNAEDAKSIAKDHLSEDADYYKKLRKMEEGKEHAENSGSAAARQETAISQGGNTMEEKERAELLQKQLDEKTAQYKELAEKLEKVNSQVAVLGEIKEDYAKFKKESEARVLANAETHKGEAKEHEAKEAEAKEFKERMQAYKEKPTWEGAADLLRKVGLTEAG